MRPNFDWSPRLSQAGGELETADTIRTDSPDAEELAGPSSRPTLSDTPQALEHAFFQAGDDGRYEGGPATIAPVAIDDEPEDLPRALPPPDPRVLARRARGARVVALVVGAMASIFAVGLVRSSSNAQQPEPQAPMAAAATVAPAPAETAATRAPAAEPTPAVQAAPEPEPAAAPPAPVAEASPPKPMKRTPRAFVPALPEVAEAPPAPPPAPPSVPAGPPPTLAFPPAG
jgi:hypothetical protein